MDISRTFERALIIAPSSFWSLVLRNLPESKHPLNCTLCYDAEALPAHIINCSDDALPFEKNSFDLVISILNLHSVNDMPGGLINIAHVLAPDGLMLAAYFGGATLSQLRQSFYSVESALNGGLSPRVIPMIDFSQPYYPKQSRYSMLSSMPPRPLIAQPILLLGHIPKLLNRFHQRDSFLLNSSIHSF